MRLIEIVGAFLIAGRRRARLCLLQSLFLLRQLMLWLTMHTLRDNVGGPVRPPNPANVHAFARGAPARDPRVTAPAAGVATHPTCTVAALQDGPVSLGHAL